MARPSYKITKAVCRKVEKLASRGLTNEQIAISLGWNPDTLYKYKRINNEFSEAIKRGQVKGLETISNKLFDEAVKGNLAAMIYYLKTRDRENWNESLAGQTHAGQPLTINFGVAPAVGDVKVTRGEALPPAANE